MFVVLGNGVVQSFQVASSGLEFGLAMGLEVQLAELGSGCQGLLHQLIRRNHPVQEAGLYSALWIENLRIHHRTVEMRRSQAMAGNLNAGVVHGHANGHFVQTSLNGPSTPSR